MTIHIAPEDLTTPPPPPAPPSDHSFLLGQGVACSKRPEAMDALRCIDPLLGAITLDGEADVDFALPARCRWSGSAVIPATSTRSAAASVAPWATAGGIRSSGDWRSAPMLAWCTICRDGRWRSTRSHPGKVGTARARTCGCCARPHGQGRRAGPRRQRDGRTCRGILCNART